MPWVWAQEPKRDVLWDRPWWGLLVSQLLALYLTPVRDLCLGRVHPWLVPRNRPVQKATSNGLATSIPLLAQKFSATGLYFRSSNRGPARLTDFAP